MKTIATLLDNATAQLLSANVPDARLDAEYLLSHILNVPRMALTMDAAQSLTYEDELVYRSYIEKRMQRIPLQYIMGYESFMGYVFKTDERALIPRPETELLVEKAVSLLHNYSPAVKVLDLCTGSGAIGISIKKKAPFAKVTLCDLSLDALSLAKANAAALNASVCLKQGDLFDAVPGERFDLILSNPPYIPHEECLSLQAEVRKEPLMALCGGLDGLDFYRRIASDAISHLTPTGALLMEIGYNQAQSVSSLLGLDYQNIAVYEDYSHLPRMVYAQRK